ncbi:DUF2797 domain-containing protein [Halioxenophilus aromaticivorans]
MPAELSADGSVQYSLQLGDDAEISLNDKLNSQITIEFAGAIQCIHCGRKTKKSFSQGYCFPCMKKLAQCDQCIMSPERCHYDAGTCREPEWADKYCMTDHYVYLSNTTAAKVGLTRGSQIPTRWIDQGAEQALPIYRTATRQQAGFVEDALRQHIADKTNWRNMLKSSAAPINLETLRDELREMTQSALEEITERFGASNIIALDSEKVIDLTFPVSTYPTKITSFNLDKVPSAEGVLQGIKGQYLIFDTGVINLRKYTGYELTFTFSG